MAAEREGKNKEEEMLNFLKEHEANVETNSLSEEKSDDIIIASSREQSCVR